MWLLFLSVKRWIECDNLLARINWKKRNFRHDNCVKIIKNLTRKLGLMENIVDIGNEGSLLDENTQTKE